MKLRWHLSGLVLGLLVPLVLLLVALVVYLSAREREAVERGMDRTVRALATAVDAVVLDTFGTLRALAASKDLRPDDLSDFLEDVEDVPALRAGTWAILTLVDASGTEVLRVDGPDGEGLQLPPVAQSEHFTAVTAQNRPVISTLATVRTGAGDILLPIAVPVLREERLRYVLTAYYVASALEGIFAEQRLEPGWAVAIVDSSTRVIARYPKGRTIIGQQASPQFAAARLRGEAGRYTVLRNDDVVAANTFMHSAQTGWTTVLSAPQESLLASGRRLTWTIAGAGALLLAVGAAVATLLGRRIARSITSLGAPARALGSGDPLPVLRPTRIAEIAELAGEMQSAAALLLQRQSERDDAESRLAVRARQQAEVAALGIEALQHSDLDTFLAAAARRTSAALDVDIGSVFEVTDQGDALRLRAGAGWSAEAIGRLTVPSGQGSHAGYTLTVGGAVVVDDYASETRFAVPTFVGEFGVLAGIAVVIHGSDRPFGVLACGSRKRRSFSPDDVSFLQAAANVLATAIARQAADRALRRSEAHHRSVIERAQEIIWIQHDGRIVFANPYAHRAFGLTPPDGLLGREILSMFHPDDRATVTTRWQHILEAAEPVPPAEMRLLRPDGGILLVEIQGMPISYEGSPAVLTMGHDITERRRAEAALRESEERNRSVVERAQQIIWIHLDDKIVFANPYAIRAFGKDAADRLIGRDVYSLFHPDDRQRAMQRTERIKRDGDVLPPAEMRLVCADGKILRAEMLGMPIPYQGRAAVLGIGHDITERRRAEDALRESERRFREFAETASDFLWEQDADRRFTFVSRDDPVLGSLTGMAIEDFMPFAVEPDLLRAHIEELKARRPFRDFIVALAGPDHRVHHMRISGRPVFDAGGEFLGYRGTGSEVTDQVEAEERLRQAQKMEAVGQLTGGIAHDFNNLLSVIIGNSEMLLERIDPEDKLSYALTSQLGQAGARGADLTGRLLAFSRRQPLKPRPAQLNELVRSMVPLLRRTLGENVEVRTALAGDLASVVVDLGQVESALLNLAVNARDAMPGGGQLTIETKNVRLDEDYAASVGDLRAGPYVMLAVSDTGCGMPPEVRQRVFEPFFTTKEKGKGTGLGLAMLYGFARQSGGHASVYSEVDVGTTVKLYLPQADAGDKTAAEQSDPVIPPGRGETVLLVEDDRAVREMLALRLADLGYRIVEAPHGRAALETIRGGTAFDVILTDVVMPSGVDGWELAQTVWREKPDTPVVFMTGYTDNLVLQRANEDQQIRVLSKPFRRSDLAAALRGALDGRRR